MNADGCEEIEKDFPLLKSDIIRVHLRSSAATLVLALAAAGCAGQAETTARRPAPTVQPTKISARPVDPVIARIRQEGLERSQVMETLDHLCNVIGPRLTASPAQQRAAVWSRDRLTSWGIANAHLEPWGPFGRGWTVDRFSFRVTAPTPFSPIAYPRAWSPGFEGPRSAEVVFLDAKVEADLAAYEGKLKDRIVLIGQPRKVDARFEPLAKRLDVTELEKLAASVPGQPAVAERQSVETASERRARFAGTNAGNEALMSGSRATSKPATTVAATTNAASTTTAPASQPLDPRKDPFVARMNGFAADQGAAMLVSGSTAGDGGTVFVQSASIPGEPPRQGSGATTRPRVWSDDAPKITPQAVMAVEDYNRLVRIARAGVPVAADVDFATSFHGQTVYPNNVLAEIRGTDLGDQVVMVGAHLDSWHAATGATDNAVGVACSMEAVRIIQSLGLRPRRTIRVALWTGEEQGLFGSSGYVKRHFGHMPEVAHASTTMAASPTTQSATAAATRGIDPVEPPGGAGNPATRPAGATTRSAHELVKERDYEKLSVYFNLDNGTGRIRGIFAQENGEAAAIFREWLKPFADLEATTVTLQNTGSTDHIPFDQIGLPGFQFVQDPIEYASRTHHSNMDVYDRIQPDDAKQASTIMAAMLWQAANMNDRFPRKPFPAPERR